MRTHEAASGARGCFWRRFDRWALALVVALQAALLLTRGVPWRGGAPTGPTPAELSVSPPPPAAPHPTLRRERAVDASPVRFRADPLRAPLSADSAVSTAAWDALRQSPTLDIRECPAGYELRLSVPGGAESGTQAWVHDRRVDIEVPLFDAHGEPAGRLIRQVQLPAAPDADQEPRIEHTNGILRIFFAVP